MPLASSRRSPRNSNAAEPCDLPRRSSPPSSGARSNPRTAVAVRSPTITPPGGARCCSREATLTTSPVAIASPALGVVTATTSPVLIPMRIARSTPNSPRSSSFSTSSRRRMRSAARSALLGSSSWATGTPKAAITASPMYFSTVPPSASISARMAVKNRLISSFRSSASNWSPSEVDPTTSAKSTVTSFRSSVVTVPCAARGVPQWEQNLAPARILGAAGGAGRHRRSLCPGA